MDPGRWVLADALQHVDEMVMRIDIV